MITQAAESSLTSDIGAGAGFLVGLIVGAFIVLRILKAVRAEFKDDKPSGTPPEMKD